MKAPKVMWVTKYSSDVDLCSLNPNFSRKSNTIPHFLLIFSKNRNTKRLLSPSLDALQESLITCEAYAKEHNLQFSADVIPSKSKTKCIAFVKDKREIKHMILCGNKLPWVDNIKHLGSVITDDSDIMGCDTMQKRASYINRNNELMQEFYFAHPISKVKINNSFNTSFYGCVLWDLFGKE